METTLNNPHLNEQQLDMLRLLKKPLPPTYFQQLRHLAVQLLGRQLDDTIDNWGKEYNISEPDYEKLSKEHYRASYKKPK
ncbi:hypothetical protein [Arachidicoccus soli]|uniref:Uncharacterized protein n=1 Tax=Arachidicoccus soli TaxID=2341117 RepID=A0A386HMK0_9BACT|nr:hypothetical protein [Arachidicoccus soli]AYD46721.1 hypothetical protein D6B99_03265 [Arachidicoccus soli]